MTGFLIKKVFFDIWDNLLSLILLSFGFHLVLVLFFLSGLVGDASTVLSFLIVILDVLFLGFYSLGVAGKTKSYSEYHKEGLRPFSEAIRYHWAHALLFSLLLVVFGLMIIYIIPFYISMESMVGFFLAMIMFWVLLISVLAMQYYFPLCLHMQGDGPLKTFKKCFIVLADNPVLSLFLFVRTIFELVLTVLTAGMIPGLAGISLSQMDTVRLLMFKYDFLEANPDCSKKDINWEDLLYDEKKLVGPRSLKGMIFPWKD